MADEPTEGDAEQTESRDIKVLRDKAKQFDDLKAQMDTLMRERAVEQSGIDVSSGPGRLFLKAYDGDNSPEAIAAAAKEYGIPLKGETSTTPEQQMSPEAQIPVVDEATGTAERQLLATGPSEPGETNPDPNLTALKAAEQARSSMGTWDDEASAFLSVLATAAANGDPRVIAKK